MTRPDVLVIGGGIAACACAYYLARAGVRVQLLERGSIGSGASKAGMSHIVTWEEPEPHLVLARASRELYEALCSDLPLDIEYRRTGSLAVVEDAHGLARLADLADRLRAWNVSCELLDENDLYKIEPGLAPGLAGGAYFSGDGQVNPLYTTQALAWAARELGAAITTQAEVTGIEVAGGRVKAVVANGERISTGQVVIAAGAWTNRVAKQAGVEIPIQPRKGTLIVTSPVPDDLLRCKILLSAGYMDSVHGGADGVSVAANIQQVKHGNLLLGSSRQFAGFDLSVDPAVVRQVLARCIQFLPALANLQAIRMWSGLRPYTPDLLPVIGPVSSVEGLWIASGHEGIGITEGPITGKIISQMITGEEIAAPVGAVLDRLSPDRFMYSEPNHKGG